MFEHRYNLFGHNSTDNIFIESICNFSLPLRCLSGSAELLMERWIWKAFDVCAMFMLNTDTQFTVIVSNNRAYRIIKIIFNFFHPSLVYFLSPGYCTVFCSSISHFRGAGGGAWNWKLKRRLLKICRFLSIKKLLVWQRKAVVVMWMNKDMRRKMIIDFKLVNTTCALV